MTIKLYWGWGGGGLVLAPMPFASKGQTKPKHILPWQAVVHHSFLGYDGATPALVGRITIALLGTHK